MMADLLGRSEREKQSANLFTPDFGLHPHRVVGRDTMLREIQDGLGRGPLDPRFISVVIGYRGSGKTVILNEAEDVAAEAGWVVLSVDATTPGIYGRIERQIEGFLETGAATPSIPRFRRKSSETELKLNAGIASLRHTITKEIQPDWDLERKLATLGRFAAQSQRGVLLSVDELHAGPRVELRRLSADLQRLTKRSELPIAFIGAGLPDIEYTLLRDRKMTFFSRCHDHRTDALSDIHVMSFLKTTIDDAHGTCEDAALRILTDASDGLPYKMQLLGYSAWVIADAPFKAIDVSAAQEAVKDTERKMTWRVYEPTWESLSSTEQQILMVVARHNGTVSRRVLGATVPMSSSWTSQNIKRLKNMGCIKSDSRGDIGLGSLTPLEMVRQFIQDQAALEPDAEDANTALARNASRRCSKPLKRVAGRCILRAGHNGRCRSR